MAREERHSVVARSKLTRPRLAVTTVGRGVVSHAGSRLLADLAEVTGLTSEFGEAVVGLRERRSAHDRGAGGWMWR